MTHLRNLPGILAEQGLWCDRTATDGRHCRQGIAHQHIKDRRARRIVTAGPGGTLADYVPFYFATRQPMLYAIKHGNVSGYDGGQETVVYLRSSTEAAAACALPCVFTDGHGDMAFVECFDDLGELEARVDWPLMRAIYWTDTPDDPNRKCRRQAEFLIHRFCPWTLIDEVGVYSDRLMIEVGGQFAAQRHRPPVRVRGEWYF